MSHSVATAPHIARRQARETAAHPRGTAHAGTRAMRAAVIAVLLLGGCIAGTTGGGGTRPGVMPKLSELPGDPEKRDAILDRSNQTAGPEQRKGMTKKERKAETAAATAAAILGSAFSKTQNVTLGGATTFEESPSKPQPPHKPDEGDKAEQAPVESDKPLVPWIQLTPQDQ